MGLQWFRRGQRGSEGSDEGYDEQFESGIEPLRSVTLGGESGNWSRSGIRSGGASEPGRRRSGGRRGWRSDQSAVSGSYDKWGSGEWSSADASSPGSRGASGRRMPSSRVLFTIFAIIILPAVTVLFVVREQSKFTGSGSPDVPGQTVPNDATPSFGGLKPSATRRTAPSPSPSPTQPQAPDSPPPAPPPTKGPPAQPPPVTRVALDTLRPAVVADGPSGQKMVTVLGSQQFPNSTSLFVNCDGKPATLTYQLNGGFTRLTTVAGLTGDATPGDLLANVVITGDGKMLAAATVSLDRIVPIGVNLTGVRTMVVSAVKARGSCGNANQPFGALGTAMLTRRR